MRRLLLLATLVTPAAHLAAQADSPPAPGRRVRVRNLLPSGAFERGIEGTVERIGPDTVVLRSAWGGELQAVPTNGDTQYFIHTGRKSSLLKGGIIGATTGLVVGAAGYAVAGKICPGDKYLCFNRSQRALSGGAIFGAVGGIAGLAIGAFSSHDVWTRSQRDELLSLVADARGVGLSFRF